MSSFLVDLWESVFIPGPTPTLLIATNATFGALQLLLLVLLVATSSIHFAVLSFLCAGLWYSINWFAREVQAAKAAEGGEAHSKDKQNNTHDTRQTSPDPTGSDTETEGDPVVATGAKPNPTRTIPSSGVQQRRKPPPPQPGQAPVPPPTSRPPAPSPNAAPSSNGGAQVTSKPVGASSNTNTRPITAQHLSPNPPTSSPPSALDGSQDLSATTTGRRRPSMGDSSGYVSTDSEWEKVSDQEGK